MALAPERAPAWFIRCPRPPSSWGGKAELDELRPLAGRHRGRGRAGGARRRRQDGDRRAVPRRALPGRATPRPAGLFVWSFYQEPDAGYFLRSCTATSPAPTRPPAPAKGAGLLAPPARGAGGRRPAPAGARRAGARPAQEGDGPGAFGQIEDPLLRGLLTRMAEGIGQTTALVTSRFPLTDLEADARPGLPAPRRRGTRSRRGAGSACGGTASGATMPRSRSWWNRTGRMR